MDIICNWGKWYVEYGKVQELYVVEHCDKFVPKFDGLQKHVGHWKTKFAHPRVHVGEYSMSLKIQHLKNKRPKFVRLHGKIMSFNKLLMVVTSSINVKLCKLLQYSISWSKGDWWWRLKSWKAYSTSFKCPKIIKNTSQILLGGIW
jgi:hypothetical protein